MVSACAAAASAAASAAQAAAAPAGGLPPAPCKISIDDPMLFKVVNTYTRETRTSAKMTDTVIADGRGAFARVVEPIGVPAYPGTRIGNIPQKSISLCE